MKELDSILLWEKLGIEADGYNLTLDIIGDCINIYRGLGHNIFLHSVNSVGALEAFLKGYELAKVGNPPQSDSI